MLQFALSFAHVHKHDLAFSGFGRTNVESLRHAGPPRQAVTQLPARLADHDDNCPICFSGLLLSNSSLPDASVNLHLPQFAETDRAFNPVSDRVFQQRHAAFLALAPPPSEAFAAPSVFAAGHVLRSAAQGACVTWCATALRARLRPPSPLSSGRLIPRFGR
ncbi:hypothetical protein AAFX91_17755 [Bradyrhizobium sp. 31Argb]|uniref:hypothetical protein n=1 Tax=Bradyrhizobium sp. 31Argb TaxID=3141247 RepID=UPI003747A4DA